jgi:outer membrane protein assembly factor BamB
MRITKKLIGAGVLALMAGCSTLSSLNPFASKPKGNQPAPLVELKGSMAVRTAWKLDIGKAQDYVFTPALVNQSLVVAGADGAIASSCGASRPRPA